MVLLGFHPPTHPRVVYHKGPNETDYPIEFEGLIGDTLTVKSEIHRMWFEAMGWKWVVAEADSKEGGSIQRVANNVNEDNITELLKEELDRLESYKD